MNGGERVQRIGSEESAWLICISRAGRGLG